MGMNLTYREFGYSDGRSTFDQLSWVALNYSGFDDIVLTVYIDNHRARRLYEKAGFVEVGHYPFRVGSTIDDDRIMRRALC